MTHKDIAALMKGMAPAIRDYVATAVLPLVERLDAIERRLPPGDSDAEDAVSRRWES
ncbi:hypothetical protein [Inquilinus limosus]|uniref:hypothetical protein n=1 Tax=Inquilinus limosus TaxID=171674 RepID=UPI00041A93FF|nr:hypothetical protein [Inquilinus limosus]